jgi:hypothetical protein
LYQRATPPAVVNVRLSGMAMACLSASKTAPSVTGKMQPPSP